MKGIMGGISRALDWVDTVSAILFTTIMIVCVFLQVIFRYVLQAPLVWSEELARYAMIYIVFIGVGYGTKTGAHLGVELLINILPEVGCKVVVGLAQILTLVLYGALFGLSLVMTGNIMSNAQLSACMRIPMWLAYAAMPIGFLSGVIRQVEVIINFWKKKTDGQGGEAH